MKKISSLIFILFTSFLIGGFLPALAADSTLDGLNSTAKDIGAYKTQAGAKGTAQTWLTGKIGGWVELILSFVGVVFLLLVIFAGLRWMFSKGNEGEITKAKELMLNAVIGLIIVTAAYSLTIFIGDNIVGK